MSGSSAADPAETLSDVSIRLCGRMAVEIGGREIGLRGRQARLVVAYLAWNRERATSRDELVELLWPREAPANPDDVLSALLSKVRAALSPGMLAGRRELALALPDGAWIDVEAATADLQRAEDAFERTDWAEVCRAGHDVLDVTAGQFLLAHDHPWVEARRRDLEELRLRTLERVGSAALELGGSGIGAAERSGRAIVESAPFRESGHLLLMEALAARGDVAEALRAYEDLRVRLRDELGAIPGAAVRGLHERLLTAPDEPPPATARDERKLVTVVALECDEPDRAREELERLEASVRPAEAGVVVGVFGIPRAHEDDAERAAEVALRMAGRAALATGDVVVCEGEPAGDVLERAQELLTVAPKRTVLVDELTARLTEHAVRYEGSQAVAREERTFRTTRRPPRTSFVGREHDLALLEAVHHTVMEESRPRLVVVVGEAGAGKSRLLDEFLRRARESLPEADVHIGRCLAYGDGLTYWPLRELLWSAAGILLHDSAAAAGEKLRRLVERVSPEPDRTVSALAVTAGIALPGNPLAGMEPESVAAEVALAWPRLATGLAAHGGAVLVVEDLHWAESALLDMLEQLVARSDGPLLVVVTARPELLEARPGWGGRRAASQLSLEPLTDDESRRLVAELLPGAPPDVRERVVEKAEGNPFFAEEIASHLRERGVRAAGAEPLPTTVRAVLAARVDALPPDEKRALQDASVVGRSFWASSLEATGASPAALRGLEERGLVTTRPTSSLPGQTELWIRHALIREVAYGSIPEAQRRTVHAGVGEWIERLASDRREEFADLLAHHFERAVGGDAPEDLRAKAVATLVEAGHLARGRAATDDAVQYADRSLALARKAPECLAALELKARALHAAIKADESLAAYQAALDLARGEDAARLRAHATLLCARYPGAFTRPEWREWATAQIDEGLAGDAIEHDTFEVGALLIGRASMVRWFVLERDELTKARAAAERAIEIAERIGSMQLLSHGLEALGWRDADFGFCEAGATGDRMLEVVRRMPDRVEASETLVIAAICLLRGGRFEDAAATARDAADASRPLSPHRRMHAASAQTTALLGAGRLQELAEATQEAPDLVEHEGSRTCAMGSLALAGHAVVRFETLDTAAGDRAAAGVEAVGLHRSDSSFRYRGIEVLRPFVGLERTRARIDYGEPVRGLVDGVHDLRARLQLIVLEDGEAIEPVIAKAREVARDACAPPLRWIADWAEAMAARSLPGAVAAADALDAYGERYTAARLMVDALVRMPDAELAAATAAKLRAMGALASAAELSGSRVA